MKHIITYDAFRRVAGDNHDWVGQCEEVNHRSLKRRLREIESNIINRFLQVDGKFVYGDVNDIK